MILASFPSGLSDLEINAGASGFMVTKYRWKLSWHIYVRADCQNKAQALPRETIELKNLSWNSAIDELV